MGNSRYCIFVILITQLPTAFIQGLSLVSLNSAAPAFETFIIQSHLSRYGSLPSESNAMLYLTLAQSALVWGCVIGALSVYSILRKLSPKNSMLIIHTVNIIAVVTSAPVAYFAASYESLIVGRFMTGVARGLGFAMSMVIVAETSARSRLGFFQSLFQVYFASSAVLGAGLGHSEALGQPGRWAWLLSLPCIASILYIIAYHWIPETPVFLLRRENDAGAENLLKRLRTVDEDVAAECAVLKQELLDESRRKSIPIFSILRAPDLRYQFVVAALAMNAMQLGGTQAIFMYSDAMLLTAGVNSAYVTFVTMALHGQIFIAFPVFYLIERRYGTKRVFILGTAIASAGMLTLTIANALQVTLPWMSNLAIAGIVVMMFGMMVGPILTLHSLITELTTSSTRPTVVLYSTSIFWIIGAVNSTVFPYSFAFFGTYAYVPFVVICFAYIPFGIFLLPETYRRTNQQIQLSIRRKSSLHVSEVFAISKRSKHRESERSELGDI